MSSESIIKKKLVKKENDQGHKAGKRCKEEQKKEQYRGKYHKLITVY